MAVRITASFYTYSLLKCLDFECSSRSEVRLYVPPSYYSKKMLSKALVFEH